MRTLRQRRRFFVQSFVTLVVGLASEMGVRTEAEDEVRELAQALG